MIFHRSRIKLNSIGSIILDRRQSVGGGGGGQLTKDAMRKEMTKREHDAHVHRQQHAKQLQSKTNQKGAL